MNVTPAVMEAQVNLMSIANESAELKTNKAKVDSATKDRKDLNKQIQALEKEAESLMKQAAKYARKAKKGGFIAGLTGKKKKNAKRAARAQHAAEIAQATATRMMAEVKQKQKEVQEALEKLQTELGRSEQVKTDLENMSTRDETARS